MSDYGKNIAAAVPICAANSYVNEFRSNKVANSDLAIWAFHNQDDPRVPVAKTTEFTDMVNKFSPEPLAKETIWPIGGHDAWKATDPAYKEDGMHIYESRNTSEP